MNNKLQYSFTIQVDSKYESRINNWLTSTRINKIDNELKDFALIKIDNKCCLLCHGDSNGNLQIKNKLYNRKSVLEAFTPALKKAGEKDLYLLSCYSGVQSTISYNDYNLKPIFNTQEEIQISSLLEGFELVVTMSSDELDNSYIQEFDSDVELFGYYE